MYLSSLARRSSNSRGLTAIHSAASSRRTAAGGQGEVVGAMGAPRSGPQRCILVVWLWHVHPDLVPILQLEVLESAGTEQGPARVVSRVDPSEHTAVQAQARLVGRDDMERCF